jgi:tetraacyldisaccharide 4'-kinase
MDASAPLLNAASKLYEGAVRLRNHLYQKGMLAPSRLDGLVVSVGNLTAGGTGKTPVAEAVARLLAERSGRKICVLSRGYRRPKPSARPVVVSDGLKVLCSWRESGDEPMVLAENLLGRAAVVVAPSRIRAGNHARRELGAEIFVLDDGFQHRSLHRDLNLLLVDGRDFFGNEKLLPAGPLREPVEGMRRADAVVFTRTERGKEEKAVGWLESRAPGTLCFFAILEAGAPEWGAQGGPLPPSRIGAFCGLARGEQFHDALNGKGFDVVHWAAFPDHHVYSREQVMRVAGEAAAKGAAGVLTTQKDWIKCREFLMGPSMEGVLPVGWLPLKARFAGERFQDWAQECLALP